MSGEELFIRSLSACVKIKVKKKIQRGGETLQRRAPHAAAGGEDDG